MVITTIGYERRARHISSTIALSAAKKVAFGFNRHKKLSYNQNYDWFRNNGFLTHECSDIEFYGLLKDILEKTRGTDGVNIRLLVDISSMSRVRIASVVQNILDCMPNIPIIADFVYTPAQYVPPPEEMSQIESVGPVLPEFAGWWDEPERPTTAIFGLGYEYDRAVGALEFIEPSSIWAFQAIGQDARFDIESDKANRIFGPSVPTKRRIRYELIKPYECFVNLESLIYGLLRDSRPILVPFGPKLFMICCLLVACVHHPKVAVWRVSSGEHEIPVDRKSNGTIVGLRTEFGP